MTFLQELKFYLSEPVYLSRLCDWGLVWGQYLAMLGMLLAVIILKDRKAIQASLAAMVAAALLVFPAEYFRKSTLPVATARAAAQQQFRATRQHNLWIFYAQALLAGAAILGTQNSDARGRGWLTAAFLGAGSAGTVALWLQFKELQLLSEGFPHL